MSHESRAESSSDGPLDKRLVLYGGFQAYQASGEVSSTKQDRPEIILNLDDLDLDEDETTPVFGAVFRFGKRWNLRLDYFGYHDDGERTADFDFNFGDLTVPIGARLDSSFDVDLYVANLSYDLIHSENARFGLGLGVHVADLDIDISGKVRVDDAEESLGNAAEDFVAPLPNLYARGAYAFTDHFLVRFGGGWMSLSYQDFDGELVFINGFLEYWPLRHFGAGAGYRYMHVDVEYDSGRRVETYDVELPGPVFYFVFGF